jgi:dTDP-4-dehydrorhamnose 3,5-epimerase
VKATPLAIPDVLLLEPVLHEDARGYFMETWNAAVFERLGIKARFIQDGVARSRRNVLRGLHYQVVEPQGKLVRVSQGEVFDVAVDLRRGSPSFGKWVSDRLSAENRRMLWIPPGFAHGYLVVSDGADVQYKISGEYRPEHERTIAWDDRDLGIDWPLKGSPILSAKDERGSRLVEAEAFE